MPHLRRAKFFYLTIGIYLLGNILLTHAALGVQMVDDALMSDTTNTTDWPAYGRTHNEQRFSPLDQINAKNVSKLKVDWFLDLPETSALAATPLVVGGVMYFTGSRNIVRAVDAISGKELWSYDPQVAKNAGERLKVAFLHGSKGWVYGAIKFLPPRVTDI